MDKYITIENPDNGSRSWKFLDGSTRSVAELPSMYIGKGIYKPGWRWSEHVRPQTGKESMRHIGYIISGKMMGKGPDGTEWVVKPGEAFEVGPGHDGWVIGDEPCVALDFEAK